MEQIGQLLLRDIPFHPQPPQALPKGNLHCVTLRSGRFSLLNHSKSGAGIQAPSGKNVAFCHIPFIISFFSDILF